MAGYRKTNQERLYMKESTVLIMKDGNALEVGPAHHYESELQYDVYSLSLQLEEAEKRLSEFQKKSTESDQVVIYV